MSKGLNTAILKSIHLHPGFEKKKEKMLKEGPHADMCSTHHALFVATFGKPKADFIVKGFTVFYNETAGTLSPKTMLLHY